MKKGFIISFFATIFIALLTIIIPIIIITKDYVDKASYYIYLTILIYLTMVLPIVTLILLVIKEAKKLPPATPSYLPSTFSILTILGVISYYGITNFIGYDDFGKYHVLCWCIIVFDILISIIAFFILRNLSKKNTPPNIVKRP